MNQNECLQQLQIYDFALQEAALFLNSHPHDANAMQYYHIVQEASQQLREQYQAQYGPLSNRENDEDTWMYINGKWPWEGE